MYDKPDRLKGSGKLILQRKQGKKTHHSWSVRSGGRPRTSPSASLALAPGGAAPALAEGTASLSFPSPTQDPCPLQSKRLTSESGLGRCTNQRLSGPGGNGTWGKSCRWGKALGVLPATACPARAQALSRHPLPSLRPLCQQSGRGALRCMACGSTQQLLHLPPQQSPGPGMPATLQLGAGHRMVLLPVGCRHLTLAFQGSAQHTWVGKAVAGSARSSRHRQGALGTRTAAGPARVSLYFCCPCRVLLSPPKPAASLSASVGPLPRQGPSTLLLPPTCWQTRVSALASCPHTLPVPAEGRSGSALSLCRS